jgi:hypothetical protein
MDQLHRLFIPRLHGHDSTIRFSPITLDLLIRINPYIEIPLFTLKNLTVWTKPMMLPGSRGVLS